MSDRILEAHSAGTRWLRQLLRHPAFQSLLRQIERLTIPGILLHYARRKNCLAALVDESLKSGVDQVVVLGAGFDGLALGLARHHPSTRLWEIDHPATQQWKARILDDAARARIRLIAADFMDGRLPTDQLAATDFDSAAPSFWIAEGLLMYLPEAMVRTLLQTIMRLTTTGGELAFSFMEKRSDGRIRFRRQTRAVDWWLARRGEPFLWSATEDEIREIFAGWKDVAFLRAEDLRKPAPPGRSQPLAEGEIICRAIR